jgi:two-component system OmpR family sensor kinase
LLFRRSLRANFLLKLTVAMATLVLITSFSLYLYIRYNTNTQIQNQLEQQAQFLLKDREKLAKKLLNNQDLLQNTLDISAKIKNAAFMHFRPKFYRTIKVDKKYYFQGFFPYNFQSQEYLVLTKDITKNIYFENKLYRAIIFINAISLIVIIFYAFFLSKMLIKPIKYFSFNIAKMNEKKLAKLELDKIPQEFKPLGNSINQLINKIENFIYYKKELFIGAAHELKTPLAVMKTKSQVTLLKRDKSKESLTTAIEQNIKSINDLNSIVESILAFGRAEGAQFEEVKNIDIIKYLNELADEFDIVAIKEEKYIVRKLYPKSLYIKLQPLLLRHILQNLLQNAIKFSPKGSKIYISCFICKKSVIIRVKDNGIGLPNNFDIFAPFKRASNSSGTGLGLFLAKNAADSLGATLTLKNRFKAKGCIASMVLPIKSIDS